MRLLFDIEADGLLIDAQNVWCLCAKDIDTDETYAYGPDDIADGVALLDSAECVIGHNIVMYDIPVLRRLYGLKQNKAIDTLLISRLLWPCRILSKIKDHKLAYWGKLLGFPKMDHTDFTRFSPEMMTYCGNDVQLGHLIYKYQKMKWGGWETAIRLEHRVAAIIAEQLENGMNINPSKAAELHKVTQEAVEQITSELQEALPGWTQVMKKPAEYTARVNNITYSAATKGALKLELKENGIRPSMVEIVAGPPEERYHPFNPGSGPDIIRAFKEKYNWKPKIFTKDDKGKPTTTPSTDGDTLEKLTFPEAQPILEFRMYRHRSTSAMTWIDSINPTTGRLHHSVITNGAVTGRMTHSDPNINIPKVRSNKDGPVLGREGEFGWECRACFEPRQGWWQVGADASGLELRMLAHYMAEFDGGEYAKILLDGDVHTHNMKAAGLSSRDQAKTFIYGFLYGAGGAKIGKIVGGSRDDGEALKAKFLRGLPALAALKASLEKHVERFGFLYGLDGRKVPTRASHSILNTHLQGGGAIVMKYATCFRRNRIVEVLGPPNTGVWGDLAMIHDEWQSEAKKKQDAEAIGKASVAALRRTGEFLKLRCRLDGEYKIGRNWAECH